MADDEAEILRQARVFASGVLAREDDVRLQAIVDEAAAAFGVPVAAVSVADRDRQYFPVSVGSNVREIDRSISFSAHAISDPGAIFCVPDARTDPRFSANPLVTGSMRIRFYAGYPLASDEHPALGALCLIDRAARHPLTDAEENLLRDFGMRCVAEVETGGNAMSHGREAIGLIASQIKKAVFEGNDRLVLALDDILKGVERGMALDRKRVIRSILPDTGDNGS
jgi:hypothetical protein